jgi:hypothetical protein
MAKNHRKVTRLVVARGGRVEVLLQLFNACPGRSAGTLVAAFDHGATLVPLAVWQDSREQEVPLTELADAGTLAATGQITSLHVVLRGIGSGGIRLPDLGVSVWPGEVALDYRMGSDWDADVLGAFVELLADLQGLDHNARLTAAGEVGPPLPEEVQKRFQRAVETYLSGIGSRARQQY